jgi:hypothetical protein
MGRGKSELEEAMKNGEKKVVEFGSRRKVKAGIALAVTCTSVMLWISSASAAKMGTQGPVFVVRPDKMNSDSANREKQVITTQSKFYCNTKALNPAERARHRALTDKLMASRKEIVETAKGYELDYSTKSVTLGELAEWVGMESKCCPFFDFHIDLEAQGSLLCLRLTGEEGIKAFIRAEFGV